MFPSVRRVVASSSSAVPPTAVVSSPAAAAVVVAAGNVVRSCLSQAKDKHQSQQRRYSSSKPSSPDNGAPNKKALPSSNSSNDNGVSSASPASAAASSSSSSASSSASSSSSSSAASSSSSSNNNSSSSSPPSSASQPAKRKRKAKETRAPAQKLPSVPSTQHLPIETLALSTFFSQHRPISITASLPKIVSDDAFATIFAPRGRAGNKTSDVIRTLSRAVNDLEAPMSGMSLNGNSNSSTQKASSTVGNRRLQKEREIVQSQKDAEQARQQRQQQLQQQQEDDAFAAEDANANSSSDSNSANSTKIEFKNPDGSDSGIYVQLNALSGQFLPFQPPPPPVPESAEGADGDLSASAAEDVLQQHHGQHDGEVAAMLEVNADGSVTAVGSSEADADAASASGDSHTNRIFKAVLTIEEQVDDNGQVRIVAHTPQIVEDSSLEASTAEEENQGLDTDIVPRSFFERMALRQLRFEDALQRQRDEQAPASPRTRQPRMLAISVKRQRKLKMKKKKYKKLMKRTRTLRRKLDRT